MKNLLFMVAVIVFLFVSCGGEESKEDPVCEEGMTMTGQTKCGLNNRGKLEQKCIDNQWVDTDECKDDDVCKDDDTDDVPCGLNNRGTKTDTCVSGSWSTGTCDDPDKCVDGKTSSCGCDTKFDGEYLGSQTTECVEGQEIEGECGIIGYEKVSNSWGTLECKNGYCFLNGSEYTELSQCWNAAPDGTSGEISSGSCGCGELELSCGSTISLEGC